jgi:hypothetical protein
VAFAAVVDFAVVRALAVVPLRDDVFRAGVAFDAFVPFSAVVLLLFVVLAIVTPLPRAPR